MTIIVFTQAALYYPIAYLSHNNLSPVCAYVYSGGSPFIGHGCYASLCVSVCVCVYCESLLEYMDKHVT